MKPVGISTANLNYLWRCAVRTRWRGRCAMCQAGEPLECHHIIHRKDYLLKWDEDNGILLCRTCHKHADTIAGRELVKELIGVAKWEYLKSMERVTKKQWFVNHGMSEDEFRMERKAMLNEVIKGA